MKIDNTDRVAELRMESDRFGRDPDAWNKKLRAGFRNQKKSEKEEEEARQRRMRSNKSDKQMTGEFGKMVRLNTRERMLSDVWDGDGENDVSLGVKIRPKTGGKKQAPNRTLMNDEHNDTHITTSRSNERPLVGYEEDDW